MPNGKMKMRMKKLKMPSKIDTPEGRKWLREMLQSQKIEVFFTKKDGTERKMLCTLEENKIPKEKLPKNSGKSQSDEALAVFDVEKNDWRSFRWDSVTKIQLSIE